MYCAKCGTQNNDSNEYCVKCGFQLKQGLSKDNAYEQAEDLVRMGSGDDFEQPDDVNSKMKFIDSKIGMADETPVIYIVFYVVSMIAIVYGVFIFTKLPNTFKMFEFYNIAINSILGITIAILIFTVPVLLLVYVIRNLFANAYVYETGANFEGISSAAEIAYLLKKSKSRYIKDIRMSGTDDLIITGMQGEYILRINKGHLVFEKPSRGLFKYYSRLAEQNAIMNYIGTVYDSKAYKWSPEKIYTGYVGILRIYKAVLATAMVALVVFGGTYLYANLGDMYVSMVKTATPEGYPNITYGKAFDSFFDNPKWKSFTSDTGQKVVQFDGTRNDMDMTVQWVIDTDKEVFTLEYMSLDGESMPILVQAFVLAGIFESHNLDKNDILGYEKKSTKQFEIQSDEEPVEEQASESSIDEGTDNNRKYTLLNSDTNKMDISILIGQDLASVISEYGLTKIKNNSGYKNDDFSVWGDPISKVSLNSNVYSLLGLYIGMDGEEACTNVRDAGWGDGTGYGGSVLSKDPDTGALLAFSYNKEGVYTISFSSMD
ncbi:zinc ribbon domain-containing protein [Butyrivibrio sp. AD3002]|uniref:zinc ribbon domain-containing protein n=1 Tax=Butyrivibrio sp. AD3002 TaxID=1280670 RepID=UPI0003B4AD03|nr:zinc ribbon domain-containing protein [Butyrivibrio sp. AD3002]